MKQDPPRGPALVPYRHMERFHEPSVADEMREATEKAVVQVLQNRVDAVLTMIRERASTGFSDVIWPDSNFTRKSSCDELAEALDAKGFTCVVRTHLARWWKSPSPEESIWEVVISW